MSAMKMIKLPRFLPNINISSHPWSPRLFATKATKPLQSQGIPDKETCEKAIEASKAVQGGAREVKETCETVRDMAVGTSNHVTKVTKDVSSNVTKSSEAVTGKSKTAVSGAVGTAKKAAKIVKGKIPK